MNRLSLFSRRQCWVPTLRGWLLLAGVLLAGALVFVRCVGAFLSLSAPLPSEALVVEWWLPDTALRAAAAEFKRGNYRYLVTCGGALSPGERWAEYKTHAGVTTAILTKLGIETNVIVTLPGTSVQRDRTYACGLAVREWIERTNKSISAVNVCSMGAHARRSRLLFQMALGDSAKVGVIGFPDDEYDTARWWAEPIGVQKIGSETLAYLYARCFAMQKLKAEKLGSGVLE